MSNTTRSSIESINTQDLSSNSKHFPSLLSYEGIKNYAFYVFRNILCRIQNNSIVQRINLNLLKMLPLGDSKKTTGQLAILKIRIFVLSTIQKLTKEIFEISLIRAKKLLFNKKLIISLSILATLFPVSTYVYLSISSNTDNELASYNTKKFDLDLQAFQLDSLELKRNIQTDTNHASLPTSRNSLRKSHIPISLRKSITDLSNPNTKKAELSTLVNIKQNAPKSNKLKSSTYSKTTSKIKANYSVRKRSSFKAQGIISRSLDQRSDIDEIINNSELTIKMVATAYDLSTKSCGKPHWHKAYGVTKSGYKATIGRTIAVDPSVIPLKSKVYISFPNEYKYLDGIYIAEDTGSKIKGKRIDVFFGEDKPGEKTVHKQARKFGVRNVVVYVLY